MKILVVHSFGLGDTIMFTPALKLLQYNFPNAKIDFLVFQSHAASPIKKCNFIHQIYYGSFSFFGLIKTIFNVRKNKYTYILHTSGTSILKMSIFLLFLRGKNKIGEYKSIKIPWYTSSISSLQIEELHRCKSNELIVETICDNKSQKFDQFYCLANQNIQFANQFLQTEKKLSNNLIGIHPGCNEKFSYKRWEVEKYIELIGKLKQDIECNIFIFIGPDEKKEGKMIKEAHDSVLLIENSLDNTVALISKMKIMVTNDSGLGHIASSFKLPTLTIVAKSSIVNLKKVIPNSDKSEVIDFRKVHTDDEVNTVFRKIEDILNKKDIDV